MRKITINQFLSDAQIKKAIDLKTAEKICAVIIEPNIDDINKKIGTKNNPMYLSYMTEYVLIKLGEYRC